MNLAPEDFRTYKIRVFDGGVNVETYVGKFYIYYSKEKDNYSVHFVDADMKHHTIFGNVIIDEI